MYNYTEVKVGAALKKIAWTICKSDTYPRLYFYRAFKRICNCKYNLIFFFTYCLSTQVHSGNFIRINLGCDFKMHQLNSFKMWKGGQFLWSECVHTRTWCKAMKPVWKRVQIHSSGYLKLCWLEMQNKKVSPREWAWEWLYFETWKGSLLLG